MAPPRGVGTKSGESPKARLHVGRRGDGTAGAIASHGRDAIVQVREILNGELREVVVEAVGHLGEAGGAVVDVEEGIEATDEDVDVRNWNDVIWALTTRVDPKRDMVLIDNSPIDYLDFASPRPGLGSKIGFDATNKWPGETDRQWGRPIVMDPDVKARVDALWERLGLD